LSSSAPGAVSVVGRARRERVARLAALLPQTQCRRCAEVDCHAYAEALADGRRDLNRCAPGGDYTMRALAAELGREAQPLDDDCSAPTATLRARVDESRCIGCALCLPACPVDAIIGARRRMHTVIEDECTGCELCIVRCPVDCIEMRPARAPHGHARRWLAERAARARARYEAHQRRSAQPRARLDGAAEHRSRALLRGDIRAAVARVRARRAHSRGP